MQALLTALSVVAYIAVPFLAGIAIARGFRAREYGVKLGWILLTVAIALSPFLIEMSRGRSPLAAVDLAIDLAGGTNLVYEVSENGPEGTPEPVTDELMNRLVAAVTRRINPAGTREVVVRRVGRDRIEVIVPGQGGQAVEEIKKSMTELGNLEFAILANNRDHKDVIARALSSRAKEVRVGTNVVARWVPVAPIRVGEGPDAKFVPNEEFRQGEEIAVRQIEGRDPGFNEVLAMVDPENRRVTGKYLSRASAGTDENGAPAIRFFFNQQGAALFQDLTSRNRPTRDNFSRRLAVILNNEVHIAPSIRDTIAGSGIINGRFTQKEVEHHVSVLNAGSLPREIKRDPISEFTISPTLGADVQSKGKLALVVSTLAVVLFMGIYYLVAGVVADIALILNLLFIVSIMAIIDAAFSLPGLAGLVLSAGMAVDANVLIYERIREETARGASLRMAINNGFDKALTAIIDSNITTLITAAILYVIGSEQVKGFAVSLFIGLVMNLFTAVYVSRALLELLERSRNVKSLKMFQLIGATKIDFVGKQNIAILASTVLIVIGMIAVVARGSNNLDIDFTGGTMISMQFNEPQKTDEVRRALEAELGNNITLEELTRLNDPKPGTRFRVRTTDQDEQAISEKINRIFGTQLVHISLTPGETIPLPADAVAKKQLEPEDEPYQGGTATELAFSSEIAPGTFEGYLIEGFKSLPSGAYKDSAADLFKLTGTGGSGVSAEPGKVRLFSKMQLLTIPSVPAADVKSAVAAVQTRMQNNPVFDEVTSFASSVAAETQISAVIAILASLVAIVAYVWFRFENLIFGIAAVIALAHDVLVTLSCVALASLVSETPIGPLFLFNDFKINMPMIAAFLTIVGYSLNDTIVIFDRLREVRGKSPLITRDMINATVNQTLSRTILTAVTVFISVLILYVLGGEGIHGFAFAMVVGTIAGTYSTVYIASPLVLWFMERMRHAPPRAGLVPAKVSA